MPKSHGLAHSFALSVFLPVYSSPRCLTLAVNVAIPKLVHKLKHGIPKLVHKLKHVMPNVVALDDLLI